jgi:hypothetical protein
MVVAWAIVLGAAACSKEPASGENGSGTSGGASGTVNANATLRIFPPKIYSGFDGANTYRAPVVAVGTGEDVEWKLSDPSLASLEVSIDGVMLTSMKAGSATITATAGGKTATAEVTINAYTPEQSPSSTRAAAFDTWMGAPPDLPVRPAMAHSKTRRITHRRRSRSIPTSRSRRRSRPESIPRGSRSSSPSTSSR